jgi:hypothetical protein
MISIFVAWVCSYDYHLVVPSVLIAAATASAALNLYCQLRSNRGIRKLAWLTGGSIAVGFGIWGMDFIGMGVFRLPPDAFSEKRLRLTEHPLLRKPYQRSESSLSSGRHSWGPRTLLSEKCQWTIATPARQEFIQRVHDDAKT